jgi:hypothetical protein
LRDGDSNPVREQQRNRNLSLVTGDAPQDIDDDTITCERLVR